jgi:periplasmic divalent cation tolerance protein
MTSTMLVVLTAIDSSERAEVLADKLVQTKLAACVQVLPPMTSFFYWEGAVQKESEHLLLIKTADEKYGELEAFVRENHSYDVPEIVAIKADRVSDAYAKWLGDYLFRP